MPASGGGVLKRKMRVDEVRSIDILGLQRNGVFKKGPYLDWTCKWSRFGEVMASISYRLMVDENGPTGLNFTYSITKSEKAEKKHYDYIVPVESTPCHYGGKRWWFVCPLVVDDCKCQRRCRIMYLPPGAEYFGCRECHRLTYESRQRHRDRFYEGFEKPIMTVLTAQAEFSRVRSIKKKVAIIQKLSRAHSTLKSFDEKYHTDELVKEGLI
jgi:hypothetical protein